ncbi:MAG: FAD-dependent oxidoreductase [Parabacteroides merdae]
MRCLLPKGLEGILTTGLGASAHRDAMPVIRMQPCLQNQGYAVGYLSALCVKENKSPRKIDIKKVQRHLVKIGNPTERVLTDKEFKGFSNSEMKKAIASVTDNYKGSNITDRSRTLHTARQQTNRRSHYAGRKSDPCQHPVYLRTRETCPGTG